MSQPDDVLKDLRKYVLANFSKSDEAIVIQTLNDTINRHIVKFYNKSCVEKSKKPAGNIWAYFLWAKSNGCIQGYN
jgi:hypothetical protein